MVNIKNKPVNYPLAEYIERLESGGGLLPDTLENLLEVVGILKSYGIVL
ncbi:MAG: CO2 hydration protein, partial [Brasilonema sp.]